MLIRGCALCLLVCVLIRGCALCLLVRNTELDRLHAHIDRDNGNIAEAVEDRLHSLLEMQTIDQNDMGVVQCAHVVGSGLIAVRIGAGGQQLRQFDGIAPYRAHDIGDKARRDHDAQFFPVGERDGQQFGQRLGFMQITVAGVGNLCSWRLCRSTGCSPTAAGSSQE